MFLTSIGQNGNAVPSNNDPDTSDFTKKLLEKAGLKADTLEKLPESSDEKRLSPDISTPPSGEKEEPAEEKGSEWD
jgi:hypothetical protein